MQHLTRSHRTLSGDVFGSAENSQALNHLLQPDGACMLVGISTAVIIGIWEFCSFFPAEIVLWRRVTKRRRPGRASFAPWTTLALRYLMLGFSVSKAFITWSTTMPTVASCKVGSGFNLATGDLLNAIVAFAIAWRAQAVARGVMQTRRSIRLMQVLVAMLVTAQIFIGIFATTYPNARKVFYKPGLIEGSCISQLAMDPEPATFPHGTYARDPLLWYYVVTILFNLACLLLVLAALHSLASRSRGFSKLITGMRNHSLFLFFMILVLSIIAIVWRAIRGVTWIYEPVTVIEAAVMIRILLAEQDAARRPLDTTILDEGYPAGAGRYSSARGQHLTPQTSPRNDGTVQFADQMYQVQQQQQLMHHHPQQAQQHTQQQQYQQHPQQSYHFRDGHQSASPPPPRTIYQPFSMMDNLGQAFSQIDSRNSRDIDGQSIDTISITRGVYPGVIQEEIRRERKGSGKEEGSGETSEEKESSSSSPGQTSQVLRRSQSVQSNRFDDENSDDEEVGTQTVNF